MYGKFSEDALEFIIHDPATPRPWINYLCNRDGRFVSLLSANAGGYCYVDCPKDGRITRWRYNSLPDDRPGRYIYLRNAKTGDYWSLSWQPVAKPKEHYQVRHGLGYSVFECDYGGVKAEATYFVPLDDPLEIRQIRLENTTSEALELEVYPWSEMVLGHALMDLVNKPNDQHFNRLWFRDDLQALFSTKTYWVTGGSANMQENKGWDQVAFMQSSLPASGYGGERERFVGAYRSESNPEAIEKGELESAPVSSGNLVSCLQHKICLQPGKVLHFHVNFGAAPIYEGEFSDEGRETFVHSNWEFHAEELLKSYAKFSQVQASLDDVKNYWREICSAVQVKTPSKSLDTNLNVWNQYQGKIAFINARNASYYHWGVTRGVGFRDGLQDILSVVLKEPELVKKRICTMAAFQRTDGTCMHYYHPVSGEGEFTGHKDDPLWLITATWHYLAESGDFSILDQSITFHDSGSGSLLFHLKASVDFIHENLGSSGIPTFGRGDWNDTLDFVGGEDGMGESSWAGMFYADNLKLLLDILRISGQKPEWIKTLETRQKELIKALNTSAWDGEWYLRARTSDGRLLGSRENKEGKIYLNPQTWSIISGVAGEREGQVMKAARRELGTSVGLKLLAPAYHSTDAGIGLITRCVWGKKENGSVFNHTNTWAIMAECLLGEGKKALELYESILPANFNQKVYEIEPYVYAQYTTSDEHESEGQGSHSWLTGTAAWIFAAGLGHILGIRPTLQGLMIDPCIDPSWKSFHVIRLYKGTTYEIEVRNPDGVQKGVRELWVDGTKQDPLTPLPELSQSTIQVQVVMG